MPSLLGSYVLKGSLRSEELTPAAAIFTKNNHESNVTSWLLFSVLCDIKFELFVKKIKEFSKHVWKSDMWYKEHKIESRTNAVI